MAAAEAEGAEHVGVGARKKLLLADDSVAVQKMIELTFADEGYQVVSVGDGAQALAKLTEWTPDVVLVDATLPGCSGYEVCARIKQDARLRRLPVVLLASAFELFDEAEARRVGANDVLTKPFQSIRQLVSKVGALLSGRSDDEDAIGRDANAPVEARPIAASPVAPEPTSSSPLSDANAHIAALPPSAPAAIFTDAAHDDTAIEALPAMDFDNQRQARRFAPHAHADIAEFASATNVNDSDDDLAALSRADAPSKESFSLPQRAEIIERNNDAVPVTSAFGVPRVEASLNNLLEEGMGATPDVFNKDNQPDGFAEQDEPQTPTTATPQAFASPIAFNDAAITSNSTMTRETATTNVDDTLLDLNLFDAPVPAAPTLIESDDLLLDLRDETNAQSTAATMSPAASSILDEPPGAVNDADTLLEFEDEMGHAAPQASAYAEAQTIGIEQQNDFALLPELALPQDSGETATASVESVEQAESVENSTALFAEVQAPAASTFAAKSASLDATNDAAATPETINASPEVAVPLWETANTQTPQTFTNSSFEASERETIGYGDAPPPADINPNELPPELVERIARRVVEQMSEKVVREIAWEVVPQLAELLIKRRLEEEKSPQ